MKTMLALVTLMMLAACGTVPEVTYPQAGETESQCVVRKWGEINSRYRAAMFYAANGTPGTVQALQFQQKQEIELAKMSCKM